MNPSPSRQTTHTLFLNPAMAATLTAAVPLLKPLLTITSSSSSFFFFFFLLFTSEATQKGAWELMSRSIGISAMHVSLLPNGKLVAFDRTDFGTSNISLPLGRCRDDLNDQTLTHDCSAHSVEFDPSTPALRPLTILTDTWCSSGHVTRHGTLVQTGGFNDGDRAVRRLHPRDGSDWEEEPHGLATRRWYATNHILPDGDTAIVLGGRRQFSYEFVPKRTPAEHSTPFPLKFLRETRDRSAENNLYPFVHLSTDGNLFVFANTKSILLDYVNHKVVRRFPEMPGGAARNYPSSGSSVLLPLLLDQPRVGARVMVCGGAPPRASEMANRSVFLPAATSCGALDITQEAPRWEMTEMPLARVMGDMVLLPNGDVLLINGAAKGCAGWLVGRDPVLSPVLYHVGATHDDELAGTFEVMSPTGTPRMYHSTAHLLSDGRVLVGGSNPNVRYEFSGVMYPTELSLEAFHPPYMSGARPRVVEVVDGERLRYAGNLTVRFEAEGEVGGGDVRVTMVAPAFATHSFTMSQRVVVVRVEAVAGLEGGGYEAKCVAPEKAVFAPAGYYMLFVVHKGVPSTGTWVRIQ